MSRENSTAVDPRVAKRGERMVRYLVMMFIFLFASVASAANSDSFKALKIDDDIKWIDETINPEDYIGQVWLVDDRGESIPYFATIPLPVKSYDQPTVKKSVLEKTSKDGSVSLLNILTLKGSDKTVYQFQIVNNKKWSVNQRDKDYVKEVKKFRNDPDNESLFKENSKVVMCIGVIKTTIWYRVYRDKSIGGSGNYFVRIDSNDYWGTDDYEEMVKYGLLLRPLNGYGVKLGKSIMNAQGIQGVSQNVKLPREVINAIVVERNKKTLKEAECADNPERCSDQ